MKYIEKTLNKFKPDRRQGSLHRRSFWHLPKIVSSILLLGVIWYLLFKVMWQIHLIAYPHHVGLLTEFWREGLGFKSFISSFLMVVPLFLPAMGASFILINLLFWHIVPIRKIFEKEAAGNQKLTFSGATAGLVKLFLKYLLPIGLGLSLIGTLTLSKLQ
jgi:hypothetical protein